MSIQDLYLRTLRGSLTRTLFMPLGQARDNRSKGLDWPGAGDAETMIGDERMDNIRELATLVLRDGIPGDFVECGVWRGGATIFMQGILKAYGEHTNRQVWVCDSFEGCPEPSPEQYPADREDPHHTFKFLAVSQDEVEANFHRYGLMDRNVRFVKGFFKDTLPHQDMRQIALLRADGDMYESQTQILEALYPLMAPGGVVIIDDYYNIAGSHKAVDDYRARRRVKGDLNRVDWCAAWWRVPGVLANTPIGSLERGLVEPAKASA